MQTTRLQQFIKTKQPLSLLKEFKLNGDNNDSEVLQIAASQGRLDVVSWLLNENVYIRSIDEKLAEQQPLMAKFLTACHALSRTVDSVVADAICFRSLYQDEKGLAECVIPNMTRPQDFIALALERKNSETAHKLLNRVRENKQEIKCTDFSNLTPGYWAAVHNLNFLKEAHADDPENWLLTLRQLGAENKDEELVKTYDAAHKTAQNDFCEQDEKEQEEKISSSFKAATIANNDVLKKLNLTQENYYELFAHAYAKKNYVAIKTILDCCDPKALLKMLLMKNEQQMSLFLLIGANFNLYDLALYFRQDTCLPKFIALAWGSEGDFKQFVQPIAKCKTLSEWETEKRAMHLNHQIQLLSRFTRALDEKIKSARCYEERLGCNTWGKKLWLLITFLTLATGLSLLTSNPACFESQMSPDYKNCTDHGTKMTIGIILTIVSGLSTIGILSLLMVDACPPPQHECRLIKCGDVRFHELPINQCGQQVQSSVDAIFDEFNPLINNPFANRTIHNPVSDILPDIKQLLKEKQSELKQLNIIPETKMEVKVEALELEEKDDFKTFNSNYRHGLFSQTDSSQPLLESESKHTLRGASS